MNEKPTKYLQPPFVFFLHCLIVAGLSCFILLHAFKMEITNDEGYSFFLLRTNYYRAMAGSANTHWLNSFFMKAFNLLFGDSPGCLRLHSLLSFPFFAFGIYNLARKLGDHFFAPVFYFTVLFNPYLLDFFSLARGYAMAFTAQVWLIIYVSESISRGRFVYGMWIRVVLLSVLAIVSNLSFLYSVLGVFCLFLFLLLVHHADGYSIKEKKVKWIFALFCSLISVAVADLLFIKYYGKDLGYGGDHNLIASSIITVWEGSFYFASYSYLAKAFSYCTFIFLVAAVSYFLFNSFKTRKIENGLVVACPVIAIFAFNVLFHIFFGTPFLYMRTALQWLPIGLYVFFLFFAEALKRIRVANSVKLLAGSFFCAALIFHFAEQANIHYSFEWRVQSESREGLIDLYKLHAKRPAIHSWINSVYLNYYRLADEHIANLFPAVIKENDLTKTNPGNLKDILLYDYIIITSREATYLKKAKMNFIILKSYPFTETVLLKLL